MKGGTVMWILLVVLVSGDGITKVEIEYDNQIVCVEEANKNTYHKTNGFIFSRRNGYTSYGRCIYRGYR